ncbi:hypothetical protein Patl1_37580 [Pistacia atlantica]|nr:hypothetical protein Patl1_37580 [Pistacia atlantica]
MTDQINFFVESTEMLYQNCSTFHRLTILVDSIMWKKLVWPEFEVIIRQILSALPSPCFIRHVPFTGTSLQPFYALCLLHILFVYLGSYLTGEFYPLFSLFSLLYYFTLSFLHKSYWEMPQLQVISFTFWKKTAQCPFGCPLFLEMSLITSLAVMFFLNRKSSHS